MTLTADAAAPAQLYPGGSLLPLYVELTNPYDRDLTFTRSRAGNRSVDSAHSACLSDPSVLVTPDVEGMSVTVAANTASPVRRAVPRAIRLTREAPDSCQGATLTVELTLT